MAGHVLDASESPLIPRLSLGSPRGAITPRDWQSIARCADVVRLVARHTVSRAHHDTVAFLAMLALVATLGGVALVLTLGVVEPAWGVPADGVDGDGDDALDAGPIDHTRLGPSDLPSWRIR